MLDRADCADFGCHNSIRLETEHFLNTLALTFISFSGHFVFAMQKHYLFFCERSSSFSFQTITYHNNIFVRTLVYQLICSCVAYTSLNNQLFDFSNFFCTSCYPQSLRAVRVLFSPMVSGWAGGRREKVCPGCISETVRCRKLILGRDIG